MEATVVTVIPPGTETVPRSNPTLSVTVLQVIIYGDRCVKYIVGYWEDNSRYEVELDAFELECPGERVEVRFQ